MKYPYLESLLIEAQKIEYKVANELDNREYIRNSKEAFERSLYYLKEIVAKSEEFKHNLTSSVRLPLSIFEPSYKKHINECLVYAAVSYLKQYDKIEEFIFMHPIDRSEIGYIDDEFLTIAKNLGVLDSFLTDVAIAYTSKGSRDSHPSFLFQYIIGDYDLLKLLANMDEALKEGEIFNRFPMNESLAQSGIKAEIIKNEFLLNYTHSLKGNFLDPDLLYFVDFKTFKFESDVKIFFSKIDASKFKIENYNYLNAIVKDNNDNNMFPSGQWREAPNILKELMPLAEKIQLDKNIRQTSNTEKSALKPDKFKV